MASYTPNLNLYKPDDSDNYEDFREGFNDNMDKLDQGGGNANQNIAEEYDDTATYAVGDYVICNGLLYKCVTAVTTAETFDPTKWTHVVVTDEMGGGGGSGDTVTWTQVQQTGTKIAEININGTSQDVYAPQGGGSGGHTIYDKDGNALAQESGLQFTGAVSVSDDSVNGRTVIDVEGGVIYLPTIYSEEERQVGVWTDGKPLYQITVDVANPSNDSNEHLVDLSALSIEKCPYLFGYAVRHSGANDLTCYANSIETDGWYYFKARYDNFRDSIMYVCLFRNDSISRMKFTIQYTKTTDVAGSGDWTPSGARAVHYSTNEQVIGTWIDGKPLYEKAFTGLSQPTNGDNWVTINGVTIPNIGEVISLNAFSVGGSGNMIKVALAEYSRNNNGDGVQVSVVSSSFNRTINTAVVQYTKTTD